MSTFIHDAGLEEIREDEDWFVDKGRYETIDVSCTLEGKVIRFERKELEGDNVGDWAKHDTPEKDEDGNILHHLKVLCCHNPEDNEDEGLPDRNFSGSKEMYDAVCTAWNLPSWTPRFLHRNHGNNSVMPFGALIPNMTRMQTYGIAFKVVESHRVITKYDPTIRTTSVLVCENPAVDPSLETILERVENSQEAAVFPLMVPFIFIEALESELNDFQGTQRSKIEGVQRKVDFYAFDDESSDDEDDDEDDDLLTYIREYVKIHTRSKTLQNSGAEGLRGIQLLQNMHQMWFDHLDVTAQDQVSDMWCDANERLLLTEVQLSDNVKYMEDDRMMIQTSIQTIYALINTNDSQANYSTAQASLRVAEDARKVALLARQDSTDMRVIAATTLIFLPATFVATLFSTNFFNFQPSGTRLVSPWIWLYFAVSAGLTLMVMIAWQILAKRREKEHEKILGPPSYEDANAERGGAEPAEPTSPVVGAEDEVPEEDGATSGASIDSVKSWLSKRKKTRTMEMEENVKETEGKEQSAKAQ